MTEVARVPVVLALDLSESMNRDGHRHLLTLAAAVNRAARYLDSWTAECNEALETFHIRSVSPEVRVMAVRDGASWLSDDFVPLSRFVCPPLVARGRRTLGAAFALLAQLPAPRSACDAAVRSGPAGLLLVVDGASEDDWTEPLSELKQEPWFNDCTVGAVSTVRVVRQQVTWTPWGAEPVEAGADVLEELAGRHVWHPGEEDLAGAVSESADQPEDVVEREAGLREFGGAVETWLVSVVKRAILGPLSHYGFLDMGEWGFGKRAEAELFSVDSGDSPGIEPATDDGSDVDVY